MSDRLRVLVVEDDAALRKLLQLRLGIDGFDVVTADDGLAALDMLEVCRPDVVVCDLMMPRLDGFGFCRRTRDTDAFRSLPIVVLTARHRDSEVDHLLDLGHIVFMSKPFDAKGLARTLRELTAPAGDPELAGRRVPFAVAS